MNMSWTCASRAAFELYGEGQYLRSKSCNFVSEYLVEGFSH